jgi:hypothetical protein
MRPRFAPARARRRPVARRFSAIFLRIISEDGPMEPLLQFGEMVTYLTGPGRREPLYGIVVSRPIGLSNVPALGHFYLVRTAGKVCVMAAHRLSRPNAMPALHPVFARRGEFDD